MPWKGECRVPGKPTTEMPGPVSLGEVCVCRKSFWKTEVPSIRWKARDTKENKQSQTYVGVDSNPGCTQETSWRVLQFSNALLKCHFYQNPWGWGPSITVFQQFSRWFHCAAKVGVYRCTDWGKEGFLNKVLLLTHPWYQFFSSECC